MILKLGLVLQVLPLDVVLEFNTVGIHSIKNKLGDELFILELGDFLFRVELNMVKRVPRSSCPLFKHTPLLLSLFWHRQLLALAHCKRHRKHLLAVRRLEVLTIDSVLVVLEVFQVIRKVFFKRSGLDARWLDPVEEFLEHHWVSIDLAEVFVTHFRDVLKAMHLAQGPVHVVCVTTDSLNLLVLGDAVALLLCVLEQVGLGHRACVVCAQVLEQLQFGTRGLRVLVHAEVRHQVVLSCVFLEVVRYRFFVILAVEKLWEDSQRKLDTAMVCKEED